jgi:hypothetical protein
MSDWNDFISNDATPHDRRLLLITQPDTFDAAQKHIYDVVVGYWNKHSSEASPQTDEACILLSHSGGLGSLHNACQ